MQALRQGIPLQRDYNGYQQEGFGQMHMTVDRGRRASTSHAYLKPARNRKNLRVISGTLATKVLLEGNRAVGIAYEKRRQ